ncbi:hypothetical protein NIES4071_57770 [Calothrix sp. NIES-4071]|nr:hypothetical protein NIES4071_57770 [Calothrix sp. NIES-4071]BAZ60084.1 hypothetical protein NIES4105_57720 [Calothrix sp. NIES-4105]
MKRVNINRHQVKATLTKVLKRILQVSILPLFVVFSLILVLPSLPAYASGLTALTPQLHTAERYSAIQTPEQALLYLNAQNLVDTWNNIIIQAKTGDEQLKFMRESGVFADDVKLTFDFANQKLELNGLSSEKTRDFYNGFVNSLKKNRYNIASNVEAVEFGKDSLRFNFKHWIFFNDRLSLVGENQAVMKRENGNYRIQGADVRVIYLDVDHAY